VGGRAKRSIDSLHQTSKIPAPSVHNISVSKENIRDVYLFDRYLPKSTIPSKKRAGYIMKSKHFVISPSFLP
jgi:hypothetical protein